MNYKLLPKERPPRSVDVSRPPTLLRRRFIAFLALFFVVALLPLNSFAASVYAYDPLSKYNEILHAPTLDEPWTTIKFCIRTSDGRYWESNPTLYYYYSQICILKNLVWPSEEALSAERKYDTWWKETLTGVRLTGIPGSDSFRRNNFTIRYWNPRKESDGNYYVDVVIDQEWYPLNIKNVTFYIKGTPNGGSPSESRYYLDVLSVSKDTFYFPVRTG